MRTHVSGLAAESASERKAVAFHLFLTPKALQGLGGNAPTIMMFIHHLRSLNHTVDYFLCRAEFVRALATRRYDVVALSGVEKDIAHLLRLAVAAKRADPCTVTTIGGFATATYGPLLLRHPAVDCVFYGESEYSFPLFLKHLPPRRDRSGLVVRAPRSADRTVAAFHRLWGRETYRSPISSDTARSLIESRFTRSCSDATRPTFAIPMNNVSLKTSEGRVLHARERRPVHRDVVPLAGEIDALLGFDLASIATAPSWAGDARPRRGRRTPATFSSLGLYLQRGCPTTPRCDICSISYRAGRRPRIEAVEALLDRAYEARVALGQGHLWSVTFADDCFAADRTWTLELCDMLHRNPQRFLFGAQTRPQDLLRGGAPDVALIRALRGARVALAIGVESFDPRRLTLMGKTRQPEDYLRCATEVLDACLSEGLLTTIYVILATPESALLDVATELNQCAALSLRSVRSFGTLPLVNLIRCVVPNSTNAFTMKRTERRYDLPITARGATIRVLTSGPVHDRVIPLALVEGPAGTRVESLRIPVRFVHDCWIEEAWSEADGRMAAHKRANPRLGPLRDYQLALHAKLAEAVESTARARDCPSRREVVEAASAARERLTEAEALALARYRALKRDCDKALRALIWTGDRLDRRRILRSAPHERTRMCLEAQLRLFRLASTVDEVRAAWLDRQYRIAPFRALHSLGFELSLSDEWVRLFAAAKGLEEVLATGGEVPDASFIARTADAVAV